MVSLWPRIPRLFSFQKRPPREAPKEKIDALFSYLFSLVAKQDTIANEIAEYKKIKQIPEEAARTVAVLKLYHAVETFLITHTPPVLKATYTVESLREGVKKNVRINQLDYRIQLVFLTGNNQLLYLFRIGVDTLALYIVQNLGPTRLSDVTMQVITEYPILEPLHTTDTGINFRVLEEQVASLPDVELILALKGLTTRLYKEITTSVGEQNALTVMKQVFTFVKESYESSLVSKFLAIMPQGTLEIERLTFLSREELEQKIKEEIVEKAKIREAQVLNEALLSSIGAGIIATDIEKNILFLNVTAEQMLGWNSKEVASLPIQNVLQLQDARGVFISKEENPVELSLSKTRPITLTQYALRRDKSRFLISITASPVIVNNERTGVILLLRDVTREKEVERARVEFLSLVSHELRTPLTSIRWNMEMLLSGRFGQLPSGTQDILKHTLETSQHMANLVNTLLNVSRIDQATISNEPTNTNLANLIASVVSEIAEEVKRKEIILTTTIDENVPKEIWIDQKLLQEVLQNLFTNAVKFNKPKGTITIHVTQKDTTVSIAVSDTGIGIPIKDQTKIFSRFFRATNVSGDTTTGYGLGLHIAKSFIESWGGTISFVSQENVGSTFTITIPQKTA